MNNQVVYYVPELGFQGNRTSVDCFSKTYGFPSISIYADKEDMYGEDTDGWPDVHVDVPELDQEIVRHTIAKHINRAPNDILLTL